MALPVIYVVIKNQTSTLLNPKISTSFSMFRIKHHQTATNLLQIVNNIYNGYTPAN